MEDIKEIKRTKEANKIIAYLILVLLSLVAFGFGGSSYMNVYLMFGFIFSLAIFTFSTEKIDKEKTKELLLFSIPLIVFALFSSLSNFWFSYAGNSLSGDLISFFGILSFFLLGYGIYRCRDIKLSWVLYAILGAIALLVLISTICSLSRYGFFYLIKYSGNTYFYDGVYYSIGDEMELISGFSSVKVTLDYGNVYPFVLCASLLGLLFVNPKKQPVLFFVILGEGAIGLLSFVLLGDFKPLIYLIPVALLAGLLRFVKLTPLTRKTNTIIGWSSLVVFSLLLLVVFVNAIGGNYFSNIPLLNKIFNNSLLLNKINQIINMTAIDYASKSFNLLSFLFGTSSSAVTAWNGANNPASLLSINPAVMEFIALYEGGILSFLGLCVFMLFVIWGLRSLIAQKCQVTGEAAIIILFMFAWVVFVSFNSSVFPFIREKTTYVSPFRRNGLFYIVIFFAGCCFKPFWKKDAILAGEHSESATDALKEEKRNEIVL